MSTWIYHHKDGDGYAAAVVVASQYCDLRSVKEMVDEDNFSNVKVPEDLHMVSVNYNKPLDLSGIKAGDIVYMLDYTSSREDDIEAMNNLWKTYGRDIMYTHIDHHKSALTTIESCEGLKEYLRLAGGIFPTEEFNQAGCMLTYIAQAIGFSMFALLFRGYYFGEETPFNNIDIKERFEKIEEDAPLWLKWTGDHDIYSEKYPESHIFSKGVFYNGLYKTYLDPKNPDSFLYLSVIEQIEIERGIRFNRNGYEMEQAANLVYEFGKQIKTIMNIHYQKQLHRSFEIYIHMALSKELLDPTDKMKLPYNEDGMLIAEGKVLCLNGIGNSEVFLDKFEEYDACILFDFDGEYVTHNIFSKKSSTFPCNALAIWGGKFFGISGGGHDHAAGFYTEKIFFKKECVYLISDNRWRITSKTDMSEEDYRNLFVDDKDRYPCAKKDHGDGTYSWYLKEFSSDQSSNQSGDK